MKLLDFLVSLTVLAVCNGVPTFNGKFNLTGVNFQLPDPAVGAKLSRFDPHNSTKKAWEFGRCYTQPAKAGRNSVTSTSSIWPLKTLYYTLSSVFTTAQRNTIMASMNNIQSNTCIKFVKRTTQTDYVRITGDSTGCWSYLGRIGGVQQLNLQKDGCLYEIGTGVHELLHALGTYHEHERNDRNEYVTVHYDNVDPEAVDNFNVVSTTEATTFGLAYDYASIMHYNSYAFTINDEKTMTANLEGAPEEFGQDNGMTALDIAKLKALYAC